MDAAAISDALSPHLAFGSGGSILWHVRVLRRNNEGDDWESAIVISMRNWGCAPATDVYVLTHHITSFSITLKPERCECNMYTIENRQPFNFRSAKRKGVEILQNVEFNCHGSIIISKSLITRFVCLSSSSSSSTSSSISSAEPTSWFINCSMI